MRKRPNKQQRKDALVAARAELALLLDGNKHSAKAMTWNTAKTREAIQHIQEFGGLPWHWTLGGLMKGGFIQTKMETKLKPLT